MSTSSSNRKRVDLTKEHVGDAAGSIVVLSAPCSTRESVNLEEHKDRCETNHNDTGSNLLPNVNEESENNCHHLTLTTDLEEVEHTDNKKEDIDPTIRTTAMEEVSKDAQAPTIQLTNVFPGKWCALKMRQQEELELAEEQDDPDDKSDGPSTSSSSGSSSQTPEEQASLDPSRGMVVRKRKYEGPVLDAEEDESKSSNSRPLLAFAGCGKGGKLQRLLLEQLAAERKKQGDDSRREDRAAAAADSASLAFAKELRRRLQQVQRSQQEGSSATTASHKHRRQDEKDRSSGYYDGASFGTYQHETGFGSEDGSSTQDLEDGDCHQHQRQHTYWTCARLQQPDDARVIQNARTPTTATTTTSDAFATPTSVYMECFSCVDEDITCCSEREEDFSEDQEEEDDENDTGIVDENQEEPSDVTYEDEDDEEVEEPADREYLYRSQKQLRYYVAQESPEDSNDEEEEEEDNEEEDSDCSGEVTGDSPSGCAPDEDQSVDAADDEEGGDKELEETFLLDTYNDYHPFSTSGHAYAGYDAASDLFSPFMIGFDMIGHSRFALGTKQLPQGTSSDGDDSVQDPEDPDLVAQLEAEEETSQHEGDRNQDEHRYDVTSTPSEDNPPFLHVPVSQEDSDVLLFGNGEDEDVCGDLTEEDDYDDQSENDGNSLYAHIRCIASEETCEAVETENDQAIATKTITGAAAPPPISTSITPTSENAFSDLEAFPKMSTTGSLGKRMRPGHYQFTVTPELWNCEPASVCHNNGNSYCSNVKRVKRETVSDSVLDASFPSVTAVQPAPEPVAEWQVSALECCR